MPTAAKTNAAQAVEQLKTNAENSDFNYRQYQDNLEIVNNALAEARNALHADPANAALVELLRANYERKLDVLRSASSYASRSCLARRSSSGKTSSASRSSLFCRRAPRTTRVRAAAHRLAWA